MRILCCNGRGDSHHQPQRFRRRRPAKAHAQEAGTLTPRTMKILFVEGDDFASRFGSVLFEMEAFETEVVRYTRAAPVS